MVAPPRLAVTSLEGRFSACGIRVREAPRAPSRRPARSRPHRCSATAARTLRRRIWRPDRRAAAACAGEHPRQRTQARVAGLMAVMIVVFLEMVDIDQQQRQRRAVAFGARPFAPTAARRNAGDWQVRSSPSEVASAASLSCRSFCSVMSREIATTPSISPVSGRARHAQSGLDPDFRLLPMPGAIDDPGLFGLAVFQGRDRLLDPRPVFGIDAGKSRRSQQLCGVASPSTRAHDGET